MNIAGEAGIGKTRLVEELVQRSGAPCLWGRTSQVDRTTPYRPLTQVLLAATHRAGRPSDPALEPFAAAVAPLLPGWSRPGAAGVVLSPAVIGEAFVQILGHGVPEAPSIVALEDLH